ncbi:hypothetical protein [Ralstonia phage phiRSL1]|uniref:Helicase/UvrB N-terminal domain-containing protein n=1 Tax=Ralstonia phage phiRSL1 TaxID=1980924 RepID=B2ZYA8_9CAUD|nr:hypothetical protein RSL1_ORF295 [Ralstonia phage phiRSL1]BAG41741.1 hypothetical protein [Ralstonia phage phiRSL1]
MVHKPMPSTTVIDYISAIPGLGKTHWAIEDMMRGLPARQKSLYLAPTIKLLEQVRNDLSRRLPPEDFKKVFMHHHKNTKNVPQAVVLSLLDPLAAKGRIVLTTHDSFLKLRRAPEFQQVTVYFDEARKVVTQGAQILLNDVGAQDLFARLFVIEPRVGQSMFRQVTCRPGAAKILRESKAFSDTPQFVKQYKRIEKLFDKATNSRYEVFLDIPLEADEIIDSGQSFLMKQHEFYEIVLPSHIFDGFKRVTVLAAHFEDSQMYHLLKEASGVKLRDVGLALGNTISKRRIALLNRYNQLTIALLTPQYMALSKTQLLYGMLAPSSKLDKILERVSSVGGVRKAMRKQTVSTAYELNKKIQAKIDYLRTVKGVEFDPLAWYIQSAKRVIRHWRRTHKSFGLPLMVLNDKFAKDEHYAEMLSDDSGCPEAELLPFMSHGLNTYKERNVLAFLAAINPAPQLIQFYRERLPNYDFAKDHVADVCNQSVCRLSLRDVKSTESVLVVVPDHSIARLLNEKLFNRATIDTSYVTRLGFKTSITRQLENLYPPEEVARLRNVRRAEASKKKQKERIVKQRAKRASSPYASRMASLNSMLTKTRRRFDSPKGK